MPLSPESGKYAWLWGLISEATEARAGTADIWSAVDDARASKGQTTRAGAWQAVNEMRSIAVAQRNAAERFQRAALGRGWFAGRGDPERWANLHPGAFDTVFTGAHAAPEINIRPAEVRAILPEYLVRFDAHFTDLLGRDQVHTVTMRDSWRPGMTIADVVNAVNDSAERMIESADTIYGTLTGISRLRPVMV